MRSGGRKSKKKNRGKNRRRGLKHWVIAVSAMGMLVAYSTGSSRAVTLRYVRVADRVVASLSMQGQTQQTQRFDIPLGTLGDVLTAL